MRFVPNYCVSYHGAFHNAGCAFEIDREDAEEMSRHGTVVADEPDAVEVCVDTVEHGAEPEETVAARKPGRPKKSETE